MAKIPLIIPPLSKEDTNRFWGFVDVRGPDECWLWKGGVVSSRKWPGRPKYGKFWLQGKTVEAHRVAYFLQKGPIPNPDRLVCHSCDVPLCCNGVHLFPGTYKDNKMDSVKKGRHAFGDKHGLRAHPEKAARGERHGSFLSPERWKFGEQHHEAKISDVIVEAIRTEYVTGGISQQRLADKYGITQSHVSKIVLRQTRSNPSLVLGSKTSI